MSRRDQIADQLGLTTGDADTIRALLNEFDVRDIAAVLAANTGAGPGGSTPGAIRRVDLGTFTPADVLTNGPTVYTPEAGELVIGVLLANITDLDGGSGALSIGDDASVDSDNGLKGMAYLDPGGDPFDSVLTAVQLDTPVRVTDQPINVGFTQLEQSPKFLPAAPEWEALTPYEIGDCISVRHDIGEGASSPWTVFRCTDDGTTGATEPDWQVQPDPTTDGTVTWEDVNNVASTGSVDVYLLVSAATT